MPPLRKIFQKNQENQEDRSASENPQFSIPFSMPLLAASILVLLCAVGWAFFMGFMIGKGENPKAQINDMTGGLLAGTETAPVPPAQNEPAPQPAMVSQGAMPAAQAPPREFARPQGSGLGAWGPDPTPDRPASLKKAEPKKAPQTVHDYAFQVAAVKSAKDAAGLEKKLQGKGLKSSSRKSGKVFVVLVNLRGSENDTAKMRQTLKTLKLGKPLLLSKKEVVKKRAKGR